MSSSLDQVCSGSGQPETSRVEYMFIGARVISKCPHLGCCWSGATLDGIVPTHYYFSAGACPYGAA